MADRYFSPDDVEALIPALTQIMERVMAAHQEFVEIGERLREEQRRIAASGGGTIDQAGWRADRARMDRLTAEVQKGLQEIMGMGGIPKDLGSGLVDFPHFRAGEEVNLCWKCGERQIRYWHGLDEGYSGRKPL